MNRPWTSHYDHPVPEPFTFPETTLDRIFVGTVANHPDWVALSFNDEDTTYRQLNDRVNRFAHGLRSLGVAKGDRVALMLPTSPVYPMAAVAVHKIGAVIVNVGVMTKGPEFAGILQATGARVLVTLDVFLPNIHPSLAAAGVRAPDPALGVGGRAETPPARRHPPAARTTAALAARLRAARGGRTGGPGACSR